MTGKLDESLDTMGDFENIISFLEQSQWKTKPGDFVNVDFLQLAAEKKVPIANGNNAGNPYYAVSFHNPLKDPAYESYFRIGPDEAIIIAGKTPPPMKYFGFAGFINNTKLDMPVDGTVISRKPCCLTATVLKDNRRLIFSSVGNTINNLTIHTTNSEPIGKGNPFSQEFIIIVTPDMNTEKLIRQAAIANGYPESMLNTLVIPPAICKLGHGLDDDNFSVGMRVAPNHDDSFTNYINEHPIKVYKVTPPTTKDLAPFAVPNLRIRGTGRTELDLLPAVKELRQAILDKYQETHNYQELTTDIWLNESYIGMQQGIDSMAESRDTVYLGTNPFILPENEDAFVIVYGANHYKTQKATYCNFIAYGREYYNGVEDTCFSAQDPDDSAAVYLPDSVDKDKLYAWKVTRVEEQKGQYCMLVPTGDSMDKLPAYKEMFIGFRAYLEPATGVGPTWQELIFDRAILFRPK
jgi:hypothetical protein